jgi:hypothetical protein
MRHLVLFIHYVAFVTMLEFLILPVLLEMK